MCIKTQKLIFLGFQNYLAQGTSLRQIYESQQVTTPKGYFPYRVFDSVTCFEWTELPKRSVELKNLMDEFDKTDESKILLRQQLKDHIDG